MGCAIVNAHEHGSIVRMLLLEFYVCGVWQINLLKIRVHGIILSRLYTR